MILEEKNKQPFIHFGFNKQEINTYIGIVVKVWQDKLYNSENYPTFSHSVSGGSISNITANSFSVVFNTLGLKLITVTDSTIKKDSNSLVVNVVERTYGATDFFCGNEILTFND